MSQRAASLFGGSDVVVEPEFAREQLREMVEDVPWEFAVLSMPLGMRGWFFFDVRRQLYGFGDYVESDGILH
jgi:hypothetical protein